MDKLLYMDQLARIDVYGKIHDTVWWEVQQQVRWMITIGAYQKFDVGIPMLRNFIEEGLK